MPDAPKNESVVIVYKDGEPVEIPVAEFLHMLEELHG